MGINAPLPEGHDCFGEKGPRGFNPDSRLEMYPGKGRLSLVEGHYANSGQRTESKTDQVKPIEDSKQVLATTEESTDNGRSEVEIALWTAPSEYQFRIGDELL